MPLMSLKADSAAAYVVAKSVTGQVVYYNVLIWPITVFNYDLYMKQLTTILFGLLNLPYVF